MVASGRPGDDDAILATDVHAGTTGRDFRGGPWDGGPGRPGPAASPLGATNDG
jgi:hypothetical protein